MPKLTASPLLRLKWTVSDDGRYAQFTVLTRSGRNVTFTIPFGEVAQLVMQIQRAAKAMAEKLFSTPARGDAQVVQSLSLPWTVTSVAVGRDELTSDAPVWVQLDGGGAISLRLGREGVHALREGLPDVEQRTRAAE